MRKASRSLLVALAGCLATAIALADGVLDGLIGEQYGATIALDSDSDGLCGYNTVDEAGARGDLIELNALSWPGADFGSQWYFSFTVDSSQPLNDQGEELSFFGSPCNQKVNYLIGIDAGCDGAEYLEMAAEGPWQRGFDWEVDYFIALYATGPDTMAGDLWQNDGDEVSRSDIAEVLVVTTTIGFRRQIEIILPDDPDIPEELRNNSPIALMVLATEDFDGEDAGVYDWIGGTEPGDCSEYPEFTAAEMYCTAPNSKAVGRPTAAGDNTLQSLSLGRKEGTYQITSELTCEDATEEPLFIDGEIDAGRYTHLIESLYAAPYAGGSTEDSDFVGESSASVYYNADGEGMSTYSSGGDADIRQVRIATDPNYLSVIVEGPTALGWLNEADRANLYIAIDVPVVESGTDDGGNCFEEPMAPAGRMVNFKGWDPDFVIELIWQGQAVLWESDGEGGWNQVADADNEAVSLIEEEIGFYYAGVFESYEFAVPWSMLGYITSVYDPQRIKLGVYTTADENTDGLSDWDIFDQAPGVGQGCTGLGCHERVGDDPGDSDCENDADPLLSDYTLYIGSTADGAAAPASNVEVGSNPPGENGNDVDTIEEYYMFDVIELPLLCSGSGGGGDCEVDEEPPTVICPPLYVDACGLPPIATSLLDFDLQGGLAIDDCDEDGLTIQHLGDTDLGGEGCEDEPIVVVREYRIYDSSGNFADCEQIINIVDTVAPVVEFPESIEVDCGESTDPSETGFPDVDDNCDNAEVTYTDEVEGGCPTIISRTWFVSDECGHEVGGLQTITIVDNEPPELDVPEEVTVEAGEPIEAEGTAVDGCDGPVDLDFEDEIVSVECEGTYLIERFWFAEDSCGNEGEAETIITVLDTMPPALIMPENVTIQCGDDPSPVFTGFAEAIDAGDEGVEAFFEDEIVEGACDNAYTINRTWMAEDDCGNFESGLQVITVVDTIPPGLVLPEDVEVDCGESTDPSETGTATAEDNCDIPNISYTDEVIGECPIVIARTWVASDACGNSETGVQTITVVDNEPPVMTVPASAEVEFGSDTSPAGTGQATASDDCSAEVDISYEDDIVPGACEGQYTIERFWMASDDCGNEAEGEQTITVVDTTPPVLNVPEDATVECGTDTSPATLGSAEADDLADEEPDVSYEDEVTAGDCDNAQIITRTWTATDACGNSVSGVQTITVVDTTAPELVVPEDLELDCGESTDPSETGSASAEDNCDIPNVTYSDSVEGTCPVVITRTWTATDACGNSVSADQTLTIADNVGPVVTAPASVTVEFGADTSPDALGFASASDSCSADLDVEYEDDVVAGDCAGSYTIERFWLAVDECGNEGEAEQTINVVDTTAPVLTVPGDVTIECNDDSSPASTGQATASDSADASPSVSYEDSVAAGDCDFETVITRVWTAEDACGNFVSEAQVITVVDTTAPELIMPADITVSCVEGSDPSVTGEAAALDNCDIPNVGYIDEVEGSCPTVITRIWTATDACGNSVSDIQVITVVDDENPVLTVPVDITIDGDSNSGPEVTGEATATDSCGDALVEYIDEVIGDCPGMIIRTWTATDLCGNSVSADQVITLIDSTPPVITCPADVEVPCGDANVSPEATGYATAEDNCSGEIAIGYTDAIDENNPLVINRTWTATDASGNTASCIQVIATSLGGGVVLNGCPEDIEVSPCEDLPDPADVTAEDGCGNPLDVVFTETVIREKPSYWSFKRHHRRCRDRWNQQVNVIIVREWTVTDAEGNTVSCTQDITITHDKNCVKPYWWWWRNADDLPVDELEIGCETYDADALEDLLTSHGGGIEKLLIRQLAVAKLNIVSGACPSASVEDCIADADRLLCQLADGARLNGKKRVKLAKAYLCLSRFNSGRAGNKICR